MVTHPGPDCDGQSLATTPASGSNPDRSTQPPDLRALLIRALLIRALLIRAETRLIECPGCDGEGGWEILTSYDPRNGEPLGYWTTCKACEGNREIEIEVQPVEMEDLDMECDCAAEKERDRRYSKRRKTP